MAITAGAVVYCLLYFLLGGRELLTLAALVLPGEHSLVWRGRSVA
jgi:hypothetical protein